MSKRANREQGNAEVHALAIQLHASASGYDAAKIEDMHKRRPDVREPWIAAAKAALKYAKQKQAQAWGEGAQFAWETTCEGWNHEYAGGNDAHPQFPEMRDNPYAD